MELLERIIAAIAGFLLFGWIGIIAGDVNTTWTDAITTGLAGACLMILIFDIPQKTKKSNDSKNNKEDK